MFHHQHGHEVNDIDVYKYKLVYTIIHQNMEIFYHHCAWESKYKIQLETTSKITFNSGGTF
jgi:hypothetical protein